MWLRLLALEGLKQLISRFNRHTEVRAAKALIAVDRRKYRRINRNHAPVPIEDGAPRAAFGRLRAVNDAARQRIADCTGGGQWSDQPARRQARSHVNRRRTASLQNLAPLIFVDAL